MIAKIASGSEKRDQRVILRVQVQALAEAGASAEMVRNILGENLRAPIQFISAK